MKLKVGRPWFTFILERFVEVPPTACFTVGRTIYAPTERIPADLAAHELTHTRQQGRTPLVWWIRWILQPGFRYDQELEAYQAQYRALAKYPRRHQRQGLFEMAKAFSSDMYAVTGFEDAHRAIGGGKS